MGEGERVMLQKTSYHPEVHSKLCRRVLLSESICLYMIFLLLLCFMLFPVERGGGDMLPGLSLSKEILS